MDKPSHVPVKSEFTLEDARFIVTKRKWLILGITTIGLAATVLTYLTREASYQSEAKLLIRYVLERGTVDPYQAQTDPDTRPGGGVINTEIEIIRSADLAIDVAERIGPTTLIPAANGKASTDDAADAISGGLGVTVGQSANVLVVTFNSQSPAIAKRVLQELIDQYFEKHLEIHRSAAAFEMVEKQNKEVHEKLQETERALDKLRTESGFVSLADATGALSSQRARTLEELMDARAELAEQQASLKELSKQVGDDIATESNSNSVTSSALPPQVEASYKAMSEILEFLHKRDIELGMRFTDGNRLLLLNRDRIAAYEQKIREMLNTYPSLASTKLSKEPEQQGAMWSLITSKAKLAATDAKIHVYQSHLIEISDLFQKQYTIGAEIEELSRKKEMEEADYRLLETNLKNARVDQALDPSRMPNITMVQQPSRPIRYYDKKSGKIMMGFAGGGLALGIGLAFMMELLIDRRIQRPTEIENRMQLPLLIAIPNLKKGGGPNLLVGNTAPQGASLEVSGKKGATGVDIQQFGGIFHYVETIRDRILFNFAANHVTHHPKIIGVTGLSKGAGVTTIASGLAGSLAHAGDTKVLIISISPTLGNQTIGEGTQAASLRGALSMNEGQDLRQVAPGVYQPLSGDPADCATMSITPVQLNKMLPALKESRFDYIIFDMPVITPTSKTFAMAGMMDLVLLVLDAEKTKKDNLAWGYAELRKCGADVSCIFNKSPASSIPNTDA
ncbi:MAG: hypothetical protein ORN51_04865 [Akkermansiaceae bacterium]|nr:hypothetical protein [Akkermansiaceae bacterium]